MPFCNTVTGPRNASERLDSSAAPVVVTERTPMTATPANPNPARLGRIAATWVGAVLCVGLLGAVEAVPGGRNAARVAKASVKVEKVSGVEAEEAAEVAAYAVRASRQDEWSELLRDAKPAAKNVRPSKAVGAARPAGVAPVRRLRAIRMEVTGYCACTKCCGPDAHGVTASGRRVSYNGGRFVAADTRVLPFGTKLQIPGYAGDRAVEVIDRGGAIKGRKLDLFFATHAEALEWGRQWVTVTVVE